jgi:hypothetical protein
MAIQLSVAVRNGRLDSFETVCGTSAVMKIFTGSPPANCAAADSGTVLATANLPSDWMAAASGGTKAKSGTWEDLSADNTGVAGHFRIYDTGEVTCHMQGTVGTSGTDMIVNSTSFTATQAFTVNTFTLTDGNA